VIGKQQKPIALNLLATDHQTLAAAIADVAD
jgi:hypothetical protein